MDHYFNKELNRAKFKKIKKNIPKDKKYILDKKINEKIFNLSEYLNSKIIFGYMANDIEIDIDNVILDSIFNNKKVAIPKCNDVSDKYEMDFYFIDNINETIVNRYNIREPKNLNKKVSSKDILNEKSIMLIPGLVFDKQGYRVGFGKGYYDRYLNNNCFKGLKIGLCYEIALINKIYYEDNDVAVDILITDERIIEMLGK